MCAECDCMLNGPGFDTSANPGALKMEAPSTGNSWGHLWWVTWKDAKGEVWATLHSERA
jgi:hypothetical protein